MLGGQFEFGGGSLQTQVLEQGVQHGVVLVEVPHQPGCAGRLVGEDPVFKPRVSPTIRNP